MPAKAAAARPITFEKTAIFCVLGVVHQANPKTATYGEFCERRCMGSLYRLVGGPEHALELCHQRLKTPWLTSLARMEALLRPFG